MSISYRRFRVRAERKKTGSFFEFESRIAEDKQFKKSSLIQRCRMLRDLFEALVSTHLGEDWEMKSYKILSVNEKIGNEIEI